MEWAGLNLCAKYKRVIAQLKLSIPFLKKTSSFFVLSGTSHLNFFTVEI